MFYSHQLLARKAPLGQIWMAATMHAKINRRKLGKLNIIHICEQILNPSVPMALRLSGILMGGVVIVYERKVKLLYDDVTRLLIKINEAWKVKPAPDPTVLPKGKSQAKKEAVTLPENAEADVPDIEQSLDLSSATTMAFQRTAYFAMRLDSVEEPYINNDLMAEDVSLHFHQADADNINLFECFDSYQANRNAYNHFERFDIEEDEETQLNFNLGEHMEIPTTLIPSPTAQDQAQRADEVQDQHPENQVNQQSDECKKDMMDQKRQRQTKRKARRQVASAMDYEQTIIPGHIYQSWLQNASDIVSRRGIKRKAQRNIIHAKKVANLMELPPTVLIDDLFTKGNGEFYYPAPLMEHWIKSARPPQDSPSERTSPPHPREPSSSSPSGGVHVQDPMRYTFEDFQSGVGSESLGVSIEKLRENIINDEIPAEILMGELRANLMSNGVRKTEDNFMTPGNSGDGVRSIPSSGSGHDVPHHSEVSSGRTNKKRPSSKQSGSSLEPVDEENSWQFPDPNFKLSRLSENGLTPDLELLVETGPTQTQWSIVSQPVDNITDSIRMQMKNHFETPGAPQVESLNKLATGMNRKGAALLFYQTCVLASREFLRVEQKMPYGEILVSKGAKM